MAGSEVGVTVGAEVRTREMVGEGPGAKQKVASGAWRSRKDCTLEAPEEQPADSGLAQGPVSALPKCRDEACFLFGDIWLQQQEKVSPGFSFSGAADRWRHGPGPLALASPAASV